jgi:hypothetical protein
MYSDLIDDVQGLEILSLESIAIPEVHKLTLLDQFPILNGLHYVNSSNGLVISESTGKKLERVTLVNNTPKSLCNLTRLRQLYCRNIHITDKDISYMKQLDTLCCDNTPITDTTTLSNLCTIRSAEMNNIRINPNVNVIS